MVKVSIIIAVLDSHEAVVRQLIHFSKMPLPHNVELIIMDDGSNPPLRGCTCCNYKLKIIATHDTRPWSQPCARNAGAKVAKGEYLLMTDIDHVLSKESVYAALDFDGDKMMFPRKWGILDITGCLDRNLEVLARYGLSLALYDKRGLSAGSHPNTFVMRKSIFEELGGYDESYCGKYGGDDVDFSKRYGKLHYAGRVARHVMGPPIYVFPDPRKDAMRIFHTLRITTKRR